MKLYAISCTESFPRAPYRTVCQVMYEPEDAGLRVRHGSQEWLLHDEFCFVSYVIRFRSETEVNP